MTKADNGVELGMLDERVEVLEFLDLRNLPDFGEEPPSDAEEETGIPPSPSEPSRLSARSALDASHRDAAPPFSKGA